MYLAGHLNGGEKHFFIYRIQRIKYNTNARITNLGFGVMGDGNKVYLMNII